MPEKYTFYLFATIGFLGVLSQMAVIYAILRTDLRRYWGVLQFLLVLFLTSVSCDSVKFLKVKMVVCWSV